MHKKISVIIPFYKTPKMKFRICIESFLAQSYQNFELLLIDDGNTKDYKQLCKEYEQKDTRVRMITQENAGVAVARNNGMKQAQGEYIVFSDSDDYVDSSFLDIMYRNLKDYDIVICGVCEQWFPSYDGTVDRKVFCSTPSQHNWLQYVNFSVNKLYKKSILDKYQIRFDPGVRLGEDALFLHRYFMHCEKIRCIPDMLYHYVPNAESAVKTYCPQYWEWEKKVIACQYKFFHQYPLNQTEEFFMRRWLFVKVKGAAYYYLSMEKDKGKRDRFVREIMHSRYYKTAFDQYRKNPFYCWRERLLLRTWKLLGMAGMKLGYLYFCRKR